MAQTNIVKNSEKQKCEHSGYGIRSDSVSSWSYDSHTSSNATISAVDIVHHFKLTITRITF